MWLRQNRHKFNKTVHEPIMLGLGMYSSYFVIPKPFIRNKESKIDKSENLRNEFIEWHDFSFWPSDINFKNIEHG